ncbi:MAG: hypothetical protein ABIL20_02960 [candidate division WOR-3 bacterium]
MKNIPISILVIFALTFAGRLGIGISGGGEYKDNYSLETYDQLPQMFYGAEFHISAEALPYMYLEPVGLIANDAMKNMLVPGIGLRVNVAPRLGKFFLAPFFGIEGDILFYNSQFDFGDAANAGRLREYFEGSSPLPVGIGFGGLSIYFGKAVSLDCQYRYTSLAKGMGVEMVYAGLTYYINW